MRRSSQRARSGRQWQVSAGSFIRLEGIKTSDCLNAKRNSGTSGKALGLSVSRTRLVSHSSELGSGVSCSARRVGSASFVTLSQQARLLRGHGTRFSLLPSCVKTQYRPCEQLAGPRLSLPAWVEAFGITAEGHVREKQRGELYVLGNPDPTIRCPPCAGRRCRAPGSTSRALLRVETPSRAERREDAAVPLGPTKGLLKLSYAYKA